MDKKVTVKDVAKEAGVSVATVSYIMNNRTDQKISDATRKKVLQIANLLNYRPSHAAVSLATGRTNVIGVAYSLDSDTPSRNMEINTFVNMLIERMNRMKYDILFLSITGDEESIITNRNIDAIIAIDLTHEQFKNLSEKYLVPIINVDMIVNDNLFYQIYTDYPFLISEAIQFLGDDSYLLIDKFANEKFLSFITESYPSNKIITISSVSSELASQLEGKKVIVIGTYLALMVHPYITDSNMIVISSEENQRALPSTIQVIYNNAAKKANLTMNILLNALNHNFDLDHDCKVI
ncbi:MAG: LacI family DNA-binding transcriptional regulator [Agathobacter sp.]|nr:LacI family DNA-binding transcriptional regulator [Agathobacter sp.]